MREENIEKMNFKELRSEVQLLRDELAIFKRKYEDAIYNLDSDNFGKSFTIEQNNMKAQIKVSAEKIETMVSKTDLDGMLEEYSKITQTAEMIKTEVTKINETFKNYSTLDQTAESIKAEVVEINNTINATFDAKFEINAEGIYSKVSEIYETQEDADAAYDNLRSSVSEISQTADEITTRVTDLETFKTSVFTQTADGFTLDGEQTTFTGVIYLTNNDNKKRFSFFHDETLGYEKVMIGSSGTCTGIPIYIGNPGDTIRFDSCSEIYWGDNAPVAVFG